MANPRIPRAIDKFNAYINDSTNYLLAGPTPPPSAPAEAGAAAALAVQPNWSRLQLFDYEMNAWSDLRNRWNVQYAKYSPKKETRTTAIKNVLLDIRQAFIDFAQSKLGRMAGSVNVTQDDAAALNFVFKRKSPTRHRTQVQNYPYFTLSPMGSGDLKWRVRPTNDSKKASMIADFELQVVFAFLPLDEPRHLQIADLTNSFISTKAIFVQHCGTQNTGKWIFVACRWVNNIDPSRNS